MSVYIPDSYRVIHYTYADMSSRNIVRPIHLVQYDDGVPIIAVKLYNDGLEYFIPENAEVNIRCRKSDGKFVYNPTLGWDSNRQTVYFEVTKQMTVVAGEIKPVVEIIVDNKVVSSGAVSLIIDYNPVQESMIMSSNEYITAKEYSEQAVDAAARASGSANLALSSSNTASNKATAAAAYAADASESASNAKIYMDNTKTYMDNTKEYADELDIDGVMMKKNCIQTERTAQSVTLFETGTTLKVALTSYKEGNNYFNISKYFKITGYSSGSTGRIYFDRKITVAVYKPDKTTLLRNITILNSNISKALRTLDDAEITGEDDYGYKIYLDSELNGYLIGPDEEVPTYISDSASKLNHTVIFKGNSDVSVTTDLSEDSEIDIMSLLDEKKIGIKSVNGKTADSYGKITLKGEDIEDIIMKRNCCQTARTVQSVSLFETGTTLKIALTSYSDSKKYFDIGTYFRVAAFSAVDGRIYFDRKLTVTVYKPDKTTVLGNITISSSNISKALRALVDTVITGEDDYGYKIYLDSELNGYLVGPDEEVPLYISESASKLNHMVIFKGNSELLATTDFTEGAEIDIMSLLDQTKLNVNSATSATIADKMSGTIEFTGPGGATNVELKKNATIDLSGLFETATCLFSGAYDFFQDNNLDIGASEFGTNKSSALMNAKILRMIFAPLDNSNYEAAVDVAALGCNSSFPSENNGYCFNALVTTGNMSANWIMCFSLDDSGGLCMQMGYSELFYDKKLYGDIVNVSEIPTLMQSSRPVLKAIYAIS